MKRAGSDPRNGSLGLLRPSHWDGRGFHPYFGWAIFGFLALQPILIWVWSVLS